MNFLNLPRIYFLLLVLLIAAKFVIDYTTNDEAFYIYSIIPIGVFFIYKKIITEDIVLSKENKEKVISNSLRTIAIMSLFILFLLFKFGFTLKIISTALFMLSISTLTGLGSIKRLLSEKN